jgi:hypothetical protein
VVVADRPLLEVESNPAGSHLFLVSSKELLHTAQWRGSFLYPSSQPITLQGLEIGDIIERFMFSAVVLFAIALVTKA